MNTLGLDVGAAVAPPAVDVVASSHAVQGFTTTELMVGRPAPVPVPRTPLETAGPVGYGATGTTVAVDLTTLTVRCWVRVLLSVVVSWVAPADAPADVACSKAPPGTLGAAGVLVASVTGQMVVYRLMISVVSWPSFAGQLVTVGAQDVMV